MSKEKIENGITIDNRIRITSELTSNKRPLYVLLQIVISWIGTLTILYSWIFGFDLDINHGFLLAWTLVSVIALLMIYELPRFRLLIGIGYPIAIAAFCYYNWKFLENGFYCIENAIIKYAAEYYNLSLFRFIVYLDPHKATTYLFFAIAQLIMIIVTLEISKHYMRSVYAFLVLLFYCTLLALGITPNGICLIAQVVVYFVMRTMDRIPSGIHRKYLGHKSETYESSADGKQRLCLHSALTITGVFLAAYLLVRLIITPYFYDKHVDLDPTKKKIQKAVTDFSVSETMDNIKNSWKNVNLFNSSNSSYSGGLDSGKIGDVGNISFDGGTALTVAMDSDISYLYLKGFAGAVYKGDEWAQLSEEDSERYQTIQEEFGGKYRAETLFYEWLNCIDMYGIEGKETSTSKEIPQISLEKRDIYVKYENANKKFLYAPYTSNYLSLGGVKYLNDSYVRPGHSGQANYLFTDNYVCYDSDSSLNDLINMVDFINKNGNLYMEDYDPHLGDFEQEYRGFVHDVYTRLPENGLKQLKSLDLGVSNEDGTNTYEVVNKVIEYLSANTTYSLSPGVPHSNQDFAEYFLFDAKKGFCSHYATAAVLLLRNYGIPARYIEGYVVTQDDIREGNLAEQNQPQSTVAEIRDYNAHAWVEVYMDGVGWIPVEVTNGYSEEGVSDIIPEIEGKEAIVTPTPNVTATPTIAPTSEAKITEQPTKASVTPTLTPRKVSKKGEDYYMAKTTMIILFVLLSLIVIAAGFYLRYHILTVKRRQVLERGSQKHRVLANYLAIERILCELKVIKKEAQTYEEFAKQALTQCYLLPKGFEDIVALALKANFSNETIYVYETKAICQYYCELRENYSESLSKKQRFMFKYWKVL